MWKCGSVEVEEERMKMDKPFPSLCALCEKKCFWVSRKGRILTGRENFVEGFASHSKSANFQINFRFFHQNHPLRISSRSRPPSR
jgi:hypothetical protein